MAKEKETVKPTEAKDEDLRQQLEEYFAIFKNVNILYVVKNGFQVFVSEDRAKQYCNKHKETYIPVKR